MDQIFRLKDSVLHFLSPPSKRRRTLPVTPAHHEQEHRFHSPVSEINDQKGRNAALLRLNQKFLSPSDTKNLRKRTREDFEEDDFTESGSGVSPDDSISQSAARGGEESTTSASEIGDEEGEYITVELGDEVLEDEGDDQEEISPDAKVQEYLARQAELALRLEDVEKARSAGGYHPDELFLYERISMRSFEELLPAEWQIDFPTLPPDLFTADKTKQFITFNHKPSSHGMRALQSLLTIGGRVRDNLEFGASTERVLTREINAYIKWSEKDGGYQRLRFLPVLTVVSARRGQSISSISTAITNQMAFLAERHRDLLRIRFKGEEGEVETYRRQPPLLYGILVAQTIAIFVTLDSANPDAKIRHLQHFEFKEKGMDVWNSIAIALMIVVARNYIMSIKDEFDEEDPPSDVDA